jgi:hypothetical protein
MVTAKLDALKVVKATGDIPQNINFAIKTGALRDLQQRRPLRNGQRRRRDENGRYRQQRAHLYHADLVRRADHTQRAEIRGGPV